MKETLLSPGVITRENDQSQYTQGPQIAGAAIVGPTVKGPVNIPTVITSYSEYLNKFGGTFESGSDIHEYLTSISAYNYFQQGGGSLLVTRVVSGSFSPSVSDIKNNTISSTGNFATTSINTSAFQNDTTGSQYSTAIETPDGNIYYFIPSVFDYINSNLDFSYFNVNSGSDSWTKAQWGAALSNSINNFSELGLTTSYSGNILSISGSQPGDRYNGYKLYFTPIYQGYGVNLTDYRFDTTVSGGTKNLLNDSFTLETLSYGSIMNSSGSEGINNSLSSGSVDNLRWEISNSNIANGTFTLLIRRGNDLSNSKVILESWSNLSLDPSSPNYIESVIGNQSYNITDNYLSIEGDYKNRSKYVRVKQVNSPTLNYFNNNGVAKSEYTSSIPISSSGSFGGATGNLSSVYGTPDSAYTSSLGLLSNKDEFQFDILTVPGKTQQSNSSVVALAIQTCIDRGDAIAVVDIVNKGANILTTIGEASELDSSYAAAYYPWLQVNSPQTSKTIWIPPSVIIPSVYEYNDNSSAVWFAPAGFKRGGIAVIQTERKLSPTDRDLLYSNKVNPIATFPGQGIVVYGQKTLQQKNSALDRINVRRLLIELKRTIGQVANTFVFEQNTTANQNLFLSKIRPYLDSVQQRGGLFAYKVIMDETNNTNDVIDRNQLVGQIYIQPTKTVEFVILDFNVSPTGADFQ